MADGVFGLNVVPGIGQFLLQAEADPLFFFVDVEDNDVDFLADLEQFGRVADAAPGHVSDVQQTIQAVEVDKSAEIGDVFDCALADVARHHFRQQLLAALGALLLDELAAREHDVLAFLIDLYDLEVVVVADKAQQVFGWDDVDLRSRQEGFDPDVDDEPALDNGLDFSVDHPAFIANGQDPIPILLELSLLLGEDNHAFTVLELFDEHIDAIANLDGFDVGKFVGGDDSLALVADIHQDFLGADFDDGSLDDFASSKAHRALLHGFFHREHNDSLTDCGRPGRAQYARRSLHCLTDLTLRWQRRVDC